MTAIHVSNYSTLQVVLHSGHALKFEMETRDTNTPEDQKIHYDDVAAAFLSYYLAKGVLQW